MEASDALVIANFGGPRELSEIRPFLEALLTDRDVIRTRLPWPLHPLIFRRVARKRAVKIRDDYVLIGGGSPIYADTEALAQALRTLIPGPVLTFHRYLRCTHRDFVQQLSSLSARTIHVFPLFPQFTYATTGSLARWMNRRLSKSASRRLRWVKSYPDHPAYIAAWQQCIRDFLVSRNLRDEEVFLLFSAHGIPKRFAEGGDPYQEECQRSVTEVMRAFSRCGSLLSFQSQFGPEEWLQPYTAEVVLRMARYTQGQRHVVVVPISFTSDHIETLFEIEHQYLPPLATQGLVAHRCPALTLRADWIAAIPQILKTAPRHETATLIR